MAKDMLSKIAKCNLKLRETDRLIDLLARCHLLQITQLKIDSNPFAKGFRDTGGGKREKK